MEEAWYEAGEEFLFEDRPDKILDVFDEITIAKLAAFLSAAFGIQGRYEIYAAMVAHVIYAYGFGKKGVDGIYSFLAGVHLAKRRYRFASIPLLVDAYESINDFRKERKINIETYAKNSLLLAGFGAAYLKWI